MNFRKAPLMALLVVAGLAHAAGALDKSDKRFVMDAATGGEYEVQAAQVAVKRASDPQVKAYAEMLVRDHTKANDELRQLAASKSIDLPRELPHDKRGRVQGLERDKPEKFDKDFLKKVGLDDHKKDIELFERNGAKATDPDVKAFADKTLPTLREHRGHAQELMGKLGK